MAGRGHHSGVTCPLLCVSQVQVFRLGNRCLYILNHLQPLIFRNIVSRSSVEKWKQQEVERHGSPLSRLEVAGVSVLFRSVSTRPT